MSTQISPGARRAAERCIMAANRKQVSAGELAEIIERETRAGALAEALDAVTNCLMGELVFSRGMSVVTEEWLEREYPTLMRARRLLAEVRR